MIMAIPLHAQGQGRALSEQERGHGCYMPMVKFGNRVHDSYQLLSIGVDQI